MNQENTNEPSCDFLFIGLEGCGKSYLIQQLIYYTKSKNKKKKEEISKKFHYTIPTAGQSLNSMKLHPLEAPVKVKEVGGSMAKTWGRHVDDCKVIVFVVDLSRKYQFAGSVVEFLSVYLEIKNKKQIILLFNKSDSSVKFEKSRFLSAIRLNELNSGGKDYPTEVLEVSGFDGSNLEILLTLMRKSLIEEEEEIESEPV